MDRVESVDLTLFDSWVLIEKLICLWVENSRDKYWVDAKVSADFLKNVFKRCSATMDAWFSCI